MRKGFTLIEAALFLALSGLLVAGLLIGTGGAIDKQRYNDSVQSFMDFLEGVYSDVQNPRSTGSGNSDKALYGKLVVIGPKVDLEGNSYESLTNPEYYTYDLLGDADLSVVNSGMTVKEQLEALNLRVTETVDKKVQFAGLAESGKLPWDAWIETTAGGSTGTTMTLTLVIVRAPISGAITTFDLTSDGTGWTAVNVNGKLKNNIDTDLFSYVWGQKQIDFCIDDYSKTGSVYSGKRVNIRLMKNAHGTTDIMKIDLDSTDNNCKVLK